MPMFQHISSWRERTLNIWISPPSFSMEKTDLYFIALHTWKKFIPYAQHNRTASVLLPNLRQYSGSKHFKAQWWHTDFEPPVLNKELQCNPRQCSTVKGNSSPLKVIRTTPGILLNHKKVNFQLFKFTQGNSCHWLLILHDCYHLCHFSG